MLLVSRDRRHGTAAGMNRSSWDSGSIQDQSNNTKSSDVEKALEVVLHCSFIIQNLKTVNSGKAKAVKSIPAGGWLLRVFCGHLAKLILHYSRGILAVQCRVHNYIITTKWIKTKWWSLIQLQNIFPLFAIDMKSSNWTKLCGPALLTSISINSNFLFY